MTENKEYKQEWIRQEIEKVITTKELDEKYFNTFKEKLNVDIIPTRSNNKPIKIRNIGSKQILYYDAKKLKEEIEKGRF